MAVGKIKKTAAEVKRATVDYSRWLGDTEIISAKSFTATPVTSRSVALAALVEIEADGAYANLRLGPLLEKSGLDDRDRLVLELQLQGVEGDDLAAALGTSTSTSYQHVHRMRERLERSIGALLVARQGRSDCDELDRLLSSWDGRFSVLWRKRVARHVDGCDICEHRRAGVPAALFGTAGASPLLVTPTSVRDRVLSTAVVGGGPGGLGPRRWRGAAVVGSGGRGWIDFLADGDAIFDAGGVHVSGGGAGVHGPDDIGARRTALPGAGQRQTGGDSRRRE